MPTRVQRSRQRLRPTASASCATPCVRAHRYHGTAVEVCEKNRLASTCLFLTVTSNTLLKPRRRRESHSTYASGEYTSHHLASHRENSVADQRGGSAWRRTPSPDPREHAHELGEALTEPRSASRPTTPSTLRSDADECPAASSMKKHVLGGRAAAAGRVAVGVDLVAGRPFVAEVGGHTCAMPPISGTGLTGCQSTMSKPFFASRGDRRRASCFCGGLSCGGRPRRTTAS